MKPRYKILPGAGLQEFRGLSPAGGPWTPVGLKALRRQVAGSQTFALKRVGGAIFCAGGFWPNPDGSERVAWMFWTPAPPARAMVEGVGEILRGLPPGPPIAAYCDADDPARAKYLRLVGFEEAGGVSSAPVATPIVPARILRMEWRS